MSQSQQPTEPEQPLDRSAQPVDERVDGRLRATPVPPGLEPRCDLVALFDDPGIDGLLSRVVPPAGLAERVRGAFATIDRPPLVAVLRAARHGDGQGAAGSPGGKRRMSRWLKTGLALGVDLATTGAAVAAVVLVMATLLFVGVQVSRRLAAPDRFDGPVVAAVGRDAPDGGGSRAAGQDPSAVAMSDRQTPPSATGSAGEGDMPASPMPDTVAAAEEENPRLAAAPVGRETPEAARPRDRSPQDVRGFPAAVWGGESWASGAGVRVVALPSVMRAVPRVRGYDILFELAHGEQPFVDPAADPALSVDHPPVGLRSDSFDRLRERLAREPSRTPRRAAASLRVEEILAALPARGGDAAAAVPAVSVAAVRSLRPAAGSLFVEVAAATPGPGGDPFDVLLMLDRSTGAFATESWQWICRGLDRVIRQMRAEDRLSIIVCGDRARLVSLRSDRDAVAALLPELLREPPCRAADFDAAFRLAAAVRRREGGLQRVVAIAHADSVERCRQEGREALAAWHADVAAAASFPSGRPVSFLLIDPEAPPVSAGEPGISAAARGGRVGADPVEIGRAMLARVFDRSTLVCTGCRLEVAFDPAGVAAYRLVGHRQTAGEIVADDAVPPVDLHAGEVVRAVYEVVVRPAREAAAGGGRSAAGLVVATLTGTLAEGGGRHRSQASWQVADVDRSAAGGAANAARGGPETPLPDAHSLEILLAVALGELAGESAHGEPWRRSASRLAGLVARWRARGDVSPLGEVVIAGLADSGVLPRSGGR